MLSLKEAIKKAVSMRDSEISGVRDCDDRWIFSFEEDVGKIGTAPVVVFKDSGRCEYFSMHEEDVEILLNGRNIDLP